MICASPSQAAIRIQSLGRGKIGRRRASKERARTQERERNREERQRNQRARKNKLARLELDAKLLDATDHESFVKFQEKRKQRAAIKVQKCWRLKIEARKMRASMMIGGIEVTPQMEAAVRVIQRSATHFINKKRRRWRPATMDMNRIRRSELDLKIKEYVKQPFKDPTWADNEKWLHTEALEKFHEYRLQRSDQAYAAAERKSLRRHIDRSMVVLCNLQSLSDLGGLETTFNSVAEKRRADVA